MSESRRIPVWNPRRFPALAIVCGFATGILLDRVLTPSITQALVLWSLGTQLLLMFALLIVWGITFRVSRRAAQIPLLAIIVLTGTVWHHLHWNVVPADHIGQFVRDAPEPFDLLVELDSNPRLRPADLPRFASAWPAEDKTQLTGTVLGFIQDRQLRTASGKILITVVGVVDNCQAGDQVRILGSVRNLTPPLNPASYDYAESMRRRGISQAMFCADQSAITRQQSAGFRISGLFSTGMEQIRSSIRGTFERTLSPETAPIASALILGERSELDVETRQAFRRSGLIHVLSISGLHVGLVGLFCFWIGRLSNLSVNAVSLAMFAGMTVCLLLAELRPPVVRAWLIGVVILIGWLSQRNVAVLQSLSVSAWVLLLINPSWLFDAGAQLSYLALLAILIIGSVLPKQFQSDNLRSTQLIDLQPRFSLSRFAPAALRPLLRYVGQSLLISLGITIVVLPLLGHTFARVTLTGIPATVLAVGVLLIALPLLLLLAACGAVWPPLASVIAVPLDLLLSVLHILATQFAGITPFTWNSVRPTASSVLGLYLLALAIAVVCGVVFRRIRPELLVLWTLCVVGLFCLPVVSTGVDSSSVECRLLSVGHGNACLVRCPNGKSLLLDAGSMENGRYAADVIAANLADMQLARIDAIVISHTDADHLNAVPFLIEQLPIQQILLNPVGLSPKHSGMQAVAERAFAAGIELRYLQPGDLLPLDDQISLHVLQAPASPLQSRRNDNADSLVLELNLFGQRLLFPGDVSDDGQQQLLEATPRQYDMIVAPHHGGRKENQPEFIAWADPKIVCVSAGYSVDRETLAQLYGHSRTLHYTCDGAIQLLISPTNPIEMAQWDRHQYWRPIR